MKQRTLIAIAAFAVSTGALADDLKPDGLWRGAGGAAVSASTGNARNSSANLTVDAARMTAVDKISVYGQALFSQAKTNDQTNTTANMWRAGTRYDHTLSGQIFGFGGLDLEHDQLKHLSLRGVLSTGLGYHVIQSADTLLDVFGGVAYKADKYADPGVAIAGQTRTSYSSPELILGEELTHKLSDSTTLKQRLVVFPNLRDTGEYRAVFDAGIAVAMTKTLNLTVSFQDRYDSLAQSPAKQNDTLFLAGINVKFGAQ